MEISITVPDDIARQLGRRWEDLPRRTLEALVAGAYREGVITGPQAQQLLGLDSRMELDAFLKEAGIFLDYTEEDLAADIRALRDVTAS
jgi:hypothetical protein